MREWNKEKIIDLLIKSGEIALKYYDSPELELKKDKSIVTAADKEIESLLALHFDRPEDNSYLIGEETVFQKTEEYVSNALKETAWIVDPIDGTAPYSHHVPTWGISIAFMKNGTIEEGAIFLPPTGEMFISDGNTVYYKSCGSNPSLWNFSNILPIKIVKNTMDGSSLINITQEITKKHELNLPNCAQALGCAVLPLAYLCLGRFTAYITGKHLKIWDFAAGLAILAKCDFKAILLNGDEMTRNIFEITKSNEKGFKRWEIKDMTLFVPDEKSYDYIKPKIIIKD